MDGLTIKELKDFINRAESDGLISDETNIYFHSAATRLKCVKSFEDYCTGKGFAVDRDGFFVIKY